MPLHGEPPRLYRAVAPTARAGIVRSASNPLIAERLQRAREQGREQLEAVFGPELRSLHAAERRAALAALDALFQFEAVDHLCEHLRLTDAQAGAALQRALRALLDHVGGDRGGAGAPGA